jgi:hypothetical protein
MKPLIELPEVAKARIRAREAESVEQSERVRRACEGDIAPAQTFWGGYFDLHSDNLAAAVEQAGATISEGRRLSAQSVFVARATEYRACVIQAN